MQRFGGRHSGGFLFVFALLALTGCPPTGEPPAFAPGDVGAQQGPCADLDDDGYVVGEGCALPPGDCAPEDADRNPGAPEACNRLDDDCDRASDEGNPGGGEDCTTDRPGLCAAGRTACEQGAIACVQIEQASVRELCNGIDDNCDGTTDEGNPGGGGDCQTGQPGRCDAGTDTCVGGRLTCVADEAADTEACNGEDDDCDGTPDEGNPGGGGACDTGLDGVCGVGVEGCVGGELDCVATRQPAAETCDGLDEDCDGQTDETFGDLGDACTVGTGACARDSVMVCAPDGLGTECDAAAGNDVPERCNAVDDDCDGRVDEDFAGLGEACEVGLGVCARPGVLVCAGDALGTACQGEAGPAAEEICNGQDDDCDGQTDETFPTVGDPCVDETGVCDLRGTLTCTDNGRGVRCAADPRQAEPEVCNAFDDDCDGLIDETFPTVGQACESGLGICARPGTTTCAAGGNGTTCDAVAGPAGVEVCNGADDDCDGFVDDGVVCPGPPSGSVNALRIAEFDEARCRDLDGDGTPDNALGSLAGLFNQRLAAAFLSQDRALLVRLPGFPAAGLAAELVEGRATDAGVVAAARAIDAFGRARHAVGGVRHADQALTTPMPGAPVRITSPLFFSENEALPYAGASFLDLAVPAVAGPVQAAPEGLTLRDLVLTGAVNRQSVLNAWQAAADACAADANPPADCDVFAVVTPAVLAANLTADLNRDGQAGNEAVSVCLVLSTEPVEVPPQGGQVCQLDPHCPVGLVCRAAPVVGADARLGTALAARCGPPGLGGAELGAACARDDDCQHALCLETTADGPRCTRLCSDAAPCEGGQACRGVAVTVPGALTQGGRSAPVCVPATGSGAACEAGCNNGEVCGVWLGGQVAVPGGVVEAAGACERPNPAGAALGASCEDAFDCAHGNGCVPDLEASLRCAPPCARPADCPGNAVCVTRPLLPALGGASALEQGFCLPVPPSVGSGDACTADIECAGGETCRVIALPGGDFERFCAGGEGFFTVGQPCAVAGDCASGVCNGGFCGGLCENDAQCTPRLDCDVDASPAGGACVPAAGACVADRDCNNDPACAGGRCVCDNRTCRIGCRFPGVCPNGLYCQPDDTCAVYCRDEDEPNDTVEAAILLDLGRRQPRVELDAALCATSPVDVYRLLGSGFPFEIEVLQTEGDDGARIEVQLVDGFGTPVGDHTGRRVRVSDAAAAGALAGQPLFLTVRGSGLEVGATYTLRAQVGFPACNDPTAEPRDEPWEFTEILTEPVVNARQVIGGAVCAQDTDWYAVFLQDGDRLTLDLEVDEAAAVEGLEIDVLGPDHPRMASSRVVASLPAGIGGRITFNPPASTCNLQTRFCQLADGTQTQMFCAGEERLCFGMPYYIRVRGGTPIEQAAYTLTAAVSRAAATRCVNDIHEQDEIFDGDRIQAALGPTADAFLELPNFVGPLATLPIGTAVSLSYRACGGDSVQPVPPDGPGFADFDSGQIALRRNERLRVEVRQPGAVQELVYAAYRFNPNTGSLEFLNALAADAAFFTTDLVAQDDNIYGIRVVRPNNGQPGGPYDYDLPYTLTLRRLPAGFLADTACASPTRVALANNIGTVTGNTQAANDDHQPLLCAGGGGPDRAFVVRLPAGNGVVSARVEATAADGYDPSVHLRTGCDADNSELACNEDDPTAADPLRASRAEAEVQGGRDVFIHVDSPDAERSGAFRLTVEWRPR